MVEASVITPQQAAINRMVESVRDLETLKITIPLGNPNLKLVHTNQFLFTALPEEFGLANMELISKALDGQYTRGSGYKAGRWYIEGSTITNNGGGDAKMELSLNPFASSISNYKENRRSYMKAYEDAFSTDDEETKKDKKKVKSTDTTNTTFKGGEGKTINNKVKDIIGKETDIYKKAKRIHEWLVDNRKFKMYLNSKRKTATSAYNHRWNPGLNCADTSRLTASMFRAAGIPCYVVHTTCHYYTVFKYKNKLYCSDATSKKRRSLNKYWKGGSGGRCHGTTHTFTGKGCYDKKCGDNPCS